MSWIDTTLRTYLYGRGQHKKQRELREMTTRLELAKVLAADKPIQKRPHGARMTWEEIHNDNEFGDFDIFDISHYDYRLKPETATLYEYTNPKAMGQAKKVYWRASLIAEFQLGGFTFKQTGRAIVGAPIEMTK